MDLIILELHLVWVFICHQFWQDMIHWLQLELEKKWEFFKETLSFKVPQGFESKGEDENPLNNQSDIKLELTITKKNT